MNETYVINRSATTPEERQTVPVNSETDLRHGGGNDDIVNGASTQAVTIGAADVDEGPPPYEYIANKPAMRSSDEVLGELELTFGCFKKKAEIQPKDLQLVTFEASLEEGFTSLDAQSHKTVGALLSTDKVDERLVEKSSLPEVRPLLADQTSGSLLYDVCLEEDDGGPSEVPVTGTRFPWQLIGFIFLVWVTVIAIAVLKGGGHRLQSPLPFVQCNNWGYWGVIACGVLILLSLQVWSRHLILHSSSATQADIIWNRTNTLIVPLLSLPAGLVASLCGIGGGMVIGPILLELGARVSSVPATSTFVVLVTASSSTIQFVLTGNLPFYYAITFATLGGSGTLLGVYLQDFILKRSSNANFVIVLIIAVILTASTALMGYSGIRNIVRLSEMGGATFGLRNLCH